MAYYQRLPEKKIDLKKRTAWRLVDVAMEVGTAQ
jgi:hypothetical protein